MNATVQPITLPRIKKRLPNLRNWLSAAGAEVLEPTNPYEVLRFAANGITSIVYRNRRNDLSFVGESEHALKLFFTAKQWSVDGKGKRRKVSPYELAVRKRDGDLCFACGWTVPAGEASLDHLVPIAHGGPNHVGNLVLMHLACNSYCGHMSAPQKVRMHVESRRY